MKDRIEWERKMKQRACRMWAVLWTGGITGLIFAGTAAWVLVR